MTAGINFGAGRRALLQAFGVYSPSSSTENIYLHFYASRTYYVLLGHYYINYYEHYYVFKHYYVF